MPRKGVFFSIIQRRLPRRGVFKVPAAKFKGTYFLNQHQITKLPEHVVITTLHKTPEEKNML